MNPSGIVRVKVVCTGAAAPHKRRTLHEGLVRDRRVAWRTPLVELHAGIVFLDEEGYAGRFRFRCPSCAGRSRVLRESTVVDLVLGLAELHERDRGIALDLASVLD